MLPAAPVSITMRAVAEPSRKVKVAGKGIVLLDGEWARAARSVIAESIRVVERTAGES
jgi:hypothetical protein